MKENIKIVVFDADDTLWENERYFQEYEQIFCELLSRHLPVASVSEELFKTEMKNLHLYGYGLKGMILCMIETICRISDENENIQCVKEVIRLGQELLEKPVELLDGVMEVVLKLHGKYKLVLATKGDLFDQRRKIAVSGLQKYFCHIEIMSDKKITDYQKLFKSLKCSPRNILMIGNSVKSDIIPVLELGGYAAHVPHCVTWAHERHEGEINNSAFIPLDNMKEILNYLL